MIKKEYLKGTLVFANKHVFSADDFGKMLGNCLKSNLIVKTPMQQRETMELDGEQFEDDDEQPEVDAMDVDDVLSNPKSEI